MASGSRTRPRTKNPATSEGIFVFTSSTPKVAVGDAVKVSGTVTEFVPGGASSGNQSVTQITRPTVTVVSSGNALPAATTISGHSVPRAYAPTGDDGANGSVNGLALQPRKYALDFYESLEGMNVKIGSSRVVTATDPFSELWVTVKPWENPNRRGGTVYGSYDSQNTGRLQIQSLIPTADAAVPDGERRRHPEGHHRGPARLHPVGGYTLTARTLGTVADGGLSARRPVSSRGGAGGGDVQRREPRPEDDPSPITPPRS